MAKKNSQRGAILIIVLWFVVIVTIMITVLASETRLSAKAVFYNKLGLQAWNDTLQALRSAEMELLINKMPDPPGVEDVPLSERKNKKYRFDGRVLDLAYPIPDSVTVRIYDHAGKINLQRLSKQKLRQLLEKRIGNDPEKLGVLEDAWHDWIDGDELKRINGAEKDYYETLSPPYEPRNSRLETVEELLLIKGFAEVFKGVEMNNAFTVYGNKTGVNPNLATREALMLLPGMSGDTIETIMTKRREEEFKSYSDFNEFMEPEQLAEFRSWVNFSTTHFFTIAVQVKEAEEIDKLASTTDESQNTDEKRDENSFSDSTTIQSASTEKQYAYMLTVKPKGVNKLPIRLMVYPYGVLPDTQHEQFLSDDDDDKKGSYNNQSKPFQNKSSSQFTSMPF
ncbi:MAG: hypothetical protein DRQ49_14185 [Gammaproteobacteria bacterium]|nr:MAG: hypothetical protein DRQ49_14185 [Gammaproteobacteria bacterium]RKZ44278.1 MAG: hypothetical protein DRQ41_03185 [Gammaproteobacteria bacterium]RKZ74580.1 MAG: hypothetical protein DRQ57_10555 [Gammaproteobacteria bacterium]